MMVEDEVAQKLEAADLWRRAASRWLDVMQHHALTDQQRDLIRQHRKYAFLARSPSAPWRAHGKRHACQFSWY